MKPLCIYHGNCADGFGAAWVVRKFFGHDGIDFHAGVYGEPEGRVFSLRSREDGADVSEIAKLYGGGGHKHASGFRVPFDRLAEFMP